MEEEHYFKIGSISVLKIVASPEVLFFRVFFLYSMKEEQNYLRRAITLAKKGLGWVNPNPLVGAVYR